MDSVGKRLKYAREKKGYIQREIAKKLGISHGTLSGYERDYRDPDTYVLAKMAEMYEVSIDWLLGRTNNSEENLSDPSKALIDNLNIELTDEEIMKNIKFTVEGQELPEQMIKDFLAYVRVERAKKGL